MPIYRQYIPSPQAELVALNPQQPAGHHRSATPVMIQGANGQPMVVQGQKAMMNGQQVIVVERPQPVQQIVQVIQSPSQRLPSQQLPLQQPEPAVSVMSTDSSQPAGYNPVAASAPPAYNPDYGAASVPPPAEEDEGAAYPNLGNAATGGNQYYHE